MTNENTEDTLTAGQAIALIREILEDPGFPSTTFWNIVTKGDIKPLEQEEGENEGSRRYARADVVRVAMERKELSSLLSVNDVVRRGARRGISIKEKELDRMVESGRLVVVKRLGRHRYFTYENVDAVLDSLADINELRKQVEGLMESTDAVEWINERLAEMGSDNRLKLDTFYHWTDDRRGMLKPDHRIPCGEKNRAWRFYFSEDTLKNAPIFKEPIKA